MKAHARDDSAGARVSETDSVTRALGAFYASLKGLRPYTKRRNLAGASALLRASYPDLWACVRTVEPPKPARARPFLRFLESRQAPGPPEDLEAVRSRVLDALNQANRLKNPSLTGRRDAALVAALCAASDRGSPRRWPQSCLAFQGDRVILWEEGVQEPAPALALRFWGHQQERLIRPGQRRLYRKGPAWARSGRPFSRAGVGEGHHRR
jgi:hypothetical protein